MIFFSTVMDEEETNTNNSVEHYGDHGQACMLMSISRSQRLLAFDNDLNVQLSTAQGSYNII